MPKGIEDKSRANRKPRGRATKVDEERVTSLALRALKTKFGTLELAFAALLESGNPKLVLFVFEHAVGKPKEKKETHADKQTADLRIGYGDNDPEIEDAEYADDSNIQEAEVVTEEEIKQEVKPPGNED